MVFGNDNVKDVALFDPDEPREALLFASRLLFWD
jgi:hypothetical protein